MRGAGEHAPRGGVVFHAFGLRRGVRKDGKHLGTWNGREIPARADGKIIQLDGSRERLEFLNALHLEAGAAFDGLPQQPDSIRGVPVRGLGTGHADEQVGMIGNVRERLLSFREPGLRVAGLPGFSCSQDMIDDRGAANQQNRGEDVPHALTEQPERSAIPAGARRIHSARPLHRAGRWHAEQGGELPVLSDLSSDREATERCSRTSRIRDHRSRRLRTRRTSGPAAARRRPRQLAGDRPGRSRWKRALSVLSASVLRQ